MYSINKGSLLMRVTKFNHVLTKKVLATDVTETFSSMRETVNPKYCEIISENLLSSKSIWDTIKIEKLPTFTKNYAQTKLTIDKHLFNIKEERKPMLRFVIASKTCPEIDLYTSIFWFLRVFSCS